MASRAQDEPRHGGLSTYDLHFTAKIRQFKPHFYHRQQGLPGLSPGMSWPAATYGVQTPYLHTSQRVITSKPATRVGVWLGPARAASSSAATVKKESVLLTKFGHLSCTQSCY